MHGEVQVELLLDEVAVDLFGIDWSVVDIGSLFRNHEHVGKLVLGARNKIDEHVADFNIIGAVDSAYFRILTGHGSKFGELCRASLALEACGIGEEDEDGGVDADVPVH